MDKIIIKDKTDYYTIHQDNITDKVVDKNVIIASKMTDQEFREKFGMEVDQYAQKPDRHLIRTDHGLLFFDEKTNEKILLI